MKIFNFVRNGTWGDYLLIESDSLAEAVSYIKENKVKNIELNFYHGYKLKDISFLKDLKKEIEGLNVIQGDIDLKGIEELTNLKMLNISDERQTPIDFSSFQHLEKCSILWHKNLKSLSACKGLRELLIKKINLSSKKAVDFIKGLSNIEQLTLIQARCNDLSYIEFFPKLKGLELYYISSLKDIAGLKFSQKTLEKLLLDHCKNIIDYQVISELKNLKYLGINDNREIQSLVFIKDLNKIQHLSFVGTNILDGNLDYCIGIDYVGFDNKKHYSHKLEDIRKS